MRVVNKQQSEGEEVKKHIGKMERDVREEGLNHIGYNISFGQLTTKLKYVNAKTSII